MKKLVFILVMAISMSASASSIRLSNGDMILDGHSAAVLAKIPSKPIAETHSTVRTPSGWEEQIVYTYKLKDGLYRVVVIGSIIKSIDWSR